MPGIKGRLDQLPGVLDSMPEVGRTDGRHMT